MHGDQVTDKNLCLALINQLKWDAVCLTSKILECDDDRLRQDYINILNRTFAEQKQAFDFAKQHGWYQPMLAEQTMIGQVQSDTQKMVNEIQQSMMTMHQQAQYQAMPQQQNLNMGQGMGAFQHYAMPAMGHQQQIYGGSPQQYYR
ncbi:spore coat protein [Desulforamulus putei]|uniref:Coat F domain-containing protein n=1 Tax=Desulforamulus putei DSM 12395 TaxID=1121429 RepID=A0A1M4TDV5_9FIRM|nr:spore coat protein [Desulforamulus putei]SHE42640.1 Coat F domain-containing protein [Desulforamulus putei DSM 12395]